MSTSVAADELFAEAELARVGRAIDADDDVAAVDAAVEREIRAAWVREHSATLALEQPAKGPCDVTQCRGLWIPVTLWTVVTATENVKLHACSELYCDGTDENMHVSNVTAKYRALGAACVQPGTSCGGVWHCRRHMRMHVCRDPCPHAYDTALGHGVCALSGRTVRDAMEFAFGQGVSVISRQIDHERQMERHEKRLAKRERDAMNPDISVTATTKRTKPATPLDRIIERRGGVSDSGIESYRTNVEDGGGDDDDDDEAVDLDYPADDLFSNAARSNTFGEGMAKDMLSAYTQAYSTVHLIIFSEERNRLERDNTAARKADALQRMRRYAADQVKDGQSIVLSTCRQLQDAALSKTRWVCKRLVVPENAVRRMKAYYAAVCMEFYLQLCMRLTAMRKAGSRARLTTEQQRLVDQFLTLNVADVAPNVFDVMHEGLCLKPHTIVPKEVVFQHLFPDSLTLDRLGIGQRMCTDVKKLMKRCVVLAVRSNLPVEHVQTTQLDLTVVIHGTEPVLSLFLAARRARLGLQ